MNGFRLALWALLLITIAPLANLVVSVAPSAGVAALLAPDTLAALRTSLGASLGSVAIASFLGIPAGYALARAKVRMRNLAILVLAIPLALPPVAAGIALLGLVGVREPLGRALAAHGIGFVDTFAGVLLAEFFVSGSVVALAATAAFGEVDRTLEDAAMTLGAGPLRVLLRVALPAAWPPIAAGILFAWLRALGEYGATSILAYHPTSLPIALVVALSADGVPRALALAEAFLALTALAVIGAAFVRRPTAR
jgi:ABC-type sulfate transport system permease component